MKSVRHATYMAITSSMLVSLSYGQGTSVVDRYGGDTVELIQVTHADAKSVVQVIRELKLPVYAVATPVSRLVVRGGKKEVALALDVVAKLDTPEASAAADVRAEFIPLGNIATTNLKRAVGSLITGSQSEFAVDYSNHMLVVRAGADELAAVKNLLASMNHPLGSVRIDLFFLRAMIGSAGADQSRELPSALVPIAKTLSASGFTGISLMAPIQVNCRMERDFRSNSVLRTIATDEKNLGDDLNFTVSGQVGPASTEDTVELEVDVGINGHFINALLEEVGDIDFSVQATIAAKFGQYVILSATPASTATGQAVAVVVRVTRDSSP